MGNIIFPTLMLVGHTLINQNTKFYAITDDKEYQEHEFEVGDHIYIDRYYTDKSAKIYTHHGIVISINPVRIHHPVDANNDIFTITDLETFYGDNYCIKDVKKAMYDCSDDELEGNCRWKMFSEKSIDVDERLRIANTNDRSVKYNLYNNNCGTFAFHCVTGIKPGCFQFLELLNSFIACRDLFIKSKIDPQK